MNGWNGLGGLGRLGRLDGFTESVEGGGDEVGYVGGVDEKSNDEEGQCEDGRYVRAGHLQAGEGGFA